MSIRRVRDDVEKLYGPGKGSEGYTHPHDFKHPEKHIPHQRVLVRRNGKKTNPVKESEKKARQHDAKKKEKKAHQHHAHKGDERDPTEVREKHAHKQDPEKKLLHQTKRANSWFAKNPDLKKDANIQDEIETKRAAGDKAEESFDNAKFLLSEHDQKKYDELHTLVNNIYKQRKEHVNWNWKAHNEAGVTYSQLVKHSQIKMHRIKIKLLKTEGDDDIYLAAFKEQYTYFRFLKSYVINLLRHYSVTHGGARWKPPVDPEPEIAPAGQSNIADIRASLRNFKSRVGL